MCVASCVPPGRGQARTGAARQAGRHRESQKNEVDNEGGKVTTKKKQQHKQKKLKMKIMQQQQQQ